MIENLQNLQLSSPSFFLGLLVGILIAWIISRLYIYIPRFYRSFRRKYGSVKKNISTGTEARLRNEIYQFAQKQHLASSLFSLDEISVEPKVLTPLIHAPKSLDLAPTDSVSLTIPYMPDWPEFGAIYKASTLSLTEALQGGSNIILAGHPGSGKTFALAWLAANLARNVRGLGRLANLLPIYVHATAIPHLLENPGTNLYNLNEKSIDDLKTFDSQHTTNINNANDVVNFLIQAISTYVTPITTTRLPRVINLALENQQAVLIIDQVDELPPNQARIITEYLRLLIEKYPKLQIIIAMSYDDLAGLPTLGFNLLALAAWTEEDYYFLLQRWSQQWDKWIAPIQKTQAMRVNSNFLRSWLGLNNILLKPFEFTLKIWGAFSGDIIGSDGPSAIELYIRRMVGNRSDTRSELHAFALQLLLKMEIASNPSKSDSTISPQSKASIHMDLVSPSDVNSQRIEGTDISLPEIKIHDIDQLTNNGLLNTYPGSRYGFSHLLVWGYFAGKAIAENNITDQIQAQPAWTGKNVALYYHAMHGDATPLIQHYLQEDDVFHTNHLLISRWLQIAPKNRAWRTIILRTLTSILQNERDTLCLAGKIISAMAFSGDVGVSVYFRQLLKSENSNLKQLAALGCGILAEKKSIDDLNQLLLDPSPATVRSAALALAAIGDKQSLEILASSLLNGSEELRRCAAEALANNPLEGQPALREGSTMEDLLVRRSVVFGLIRVNQPWATKIVENLQLEDNEWVVRNAAIQAFEELHRKISYAPVQLPDLTETQWLIDFATKNNTSIAPGKPAEQLVSKVLLTGSPEEKIFALNYYRTRCDPKTRDMIFSFFSNNSRDLRDYAYYILWLMVLAGIKPPISLG